MGPVGYGKVLGGAPALEGRVGDGPAAVEPFDRRRLRCVGGLAGVVPRDADFDILSRH